MTVGTAQVGGITEPRELGRDRAEQARGPPDPLLGDLAQTVLLHRGHARLLARPQGLPDPESSSAGAVERALYGLAGLAREFVPEVLPDTGRTGRRGPDRCVVRVAGHRCLLRCVLLLSDGIRNR